jgi:hypothetical protein
VSGRCGFDAVTVDAVARRRGLESDGLQLLRVRGLADEAREALAAHFEGPNAGLVASLVVAGWRAAYRAGLDVARRGKNPQKAAAELGRVLDGAMAAARAAMRASGSA